MSTFSKLSVVAQYDDMCRLANSLIKETADEEENYISMTKDLQRRWNARQLKNESEKDSLRSEVFALQKDIKKLQRQLAESRTALMREAEEKKLIAREKRTLLDQIKQVRQLVESKDGLNDVDAHRRRVIRCLDVERLSPIQSDDSDDCLSGLDYDRTEEDILDGERSRRSAFEESIRQNEQPTLLLDRDVDSEEQQQKDHLRRSSRRSNQTQRYSSEHRSATVTRSNTAANLRDKLSYNLDTDSNDIETDDNVMETDDNVIETVRQQMKEYYAKDKKQLASINSTPTMHKTNKAATLSAKSTANLMRTASNAKTPVPNTLKPHSFVSKRTFIPEHCVPCGERIAFYGDVDKCENCGVLCHPRCREKCPLPCVKITAPNTRSRQKKVLISDFVNSDAVPKVPALIVHCCNEIEREDNIVTSGLYRVVAHTKDVEDWQQKILKSKSGMPNLSKLEVHLLTGVVKRFLQCLDESLITTTLWGQMSEAINGSEEDACIHMSFYIQNDLPPANRDTLAFMMQHLHAIAKHSDKNCMTTSSLAKALAPTIVGNSCRNATQTTIASETKRQVQIMEALFRIEESFWAQFAPRVSTSSPKSASLGSRLLGTSTPSASGGHSTRRTTRNSKNGSTLPTPKIKPLWYS